MNKEINNNKKKVLMIIFAISLILIIGLAGTYAWYVWSSSEDDVTKIVTGVGAATVTYQDGGNIIGYNLGPETDKSLGIVKEITVSTSEDTVSDITFNLYLDINTLNDELKHESFKYALYDDTGREVSIGNFAETPVGCTVNSTNHIVLASNEIIDSTLSTYTLYIWIDGTMDNPASMQGKNFRFTLHADGQNAILYREVVTNMLMFVDNEDSDADTDVFLRRNEEGHGLLRNQVGSVNFVESINIPEGNTSIDVSELQDESVMMWYGETNTNGYYDVYIGGANGNTIIIDGAQLFACLTNAKTINFNNAIDTSNMTSMLKMFNQCVNLISIDFSGINTSNVTNLKYTFQNCQSIEELDIGNWDTSNVETLCATFKNCYNLLSLDLSGWNTTRVTDMAGLFLYCEKIQNLDISTWDTSNVRDMGDMFVGIKLSSLDLSNFNTENVTSMAGMFGYCSNLTSLDLSSFNTKSVTSMLYMFHSCSNLTSLDLSGWNTSKVTDMSFAFSDCTKLSTINVGDDWSTKSVTNSSYMFYGCTSLVGGSGTIYNASKIDAEYARVDGGTSSPGYFTYKAASV